jgi:multiple sugar transport system substrate-binding protein
MKGKAFALTIILPLIMGLLLTACGGPAPTPQVIVQTAPPQTVVVTAPPVEVTRAVEVTKVVPQERVEVRLSGWASSPAETALLESLLYKFSVAHPDIVVKYEPITGDFWQKIKTMVASNTEPDIYYMDIFQFPFFASKGVLVALDDYMAQDGVKREDFIPTLINAFTYEGKVYGIPKDFNTLGLFYNKALFREAGLDEPTDDWTWDDLKAAAQKLTNKGKNIYGFGTPPDPGRFPVFVFQNGGTIMTPDFSDTTLDSPEAVAAAEFYTSFRKEGIGAIPADIGVGWQGEGFGKGQLAMVYEGGWLIPYLKEQFPDLEYGVVQPPAGPKGEGNLVFTVAYSISKNSKHPEAAWKVIHFLTNEESQTTVLQSGFALPSRVALTESDYLKNNPNVKAIWDGAAHATPFMWGLYGSDVNDQMGKALERIFLQDQSPADSMKQAAEEIRKIIKGG